MAIIGVYKITSPNKRVYVGSSNNIKRRWSKYRNLKCKSQIRLYNSFKKYGVNRHKFEIITECDVKDMLAIELHWGLFYNVLDKKAGLNLKLPKNGEQYQCVSEETKEKLRIYNTGRPSPKKGIKTGKPAWNRGIPLTKERNEQLIKSREGMKRWNKGIPMKEEVKTKLRKANKGLIPWNKGAKGVQEAWNKGKKWSEESKKKMSENSKGQIAWNKGKKTNQITHNSRLILCQETGVFYYSIERASRVYNITPPKLRHMLVGNTKNTTSLIFA